MKLIAEEITQVDFLCEEKEGKKNYFIEGIFLQAELQNRNGRMYKLPTLQREVAKYDENYIQKGRALGELGHPDGPSINLDRVSHKITSLKEDGNNFIGRAQLLDTPLGKIAKNLLKYKDHCGDSVFDFSGYKPYVRQIAQCMGLKQEGLPCCYGPQMPHSISKSVKAT